MAEHQCAGCEQLFEVDGELPAGMPFVCVDCGNALEQQDRRSVLRLELAPVQGIARRWTITTTATGPNGEELHHDTWPVSLATTPKNRIAHFLKLNVDGIIDTVRAQLGIAGVDLRLEVVGLDETCT